jgi:hypothetical protein
MIQKRDLHQEVSCKDAGPSFPTIGALVQESTRVVQVPVIMEVSNCLQKVHKSQRFLPQAKSSFFILTSIPSVMMNLKSF